MDEVALDRAFVIEGHVGDLERADGQGLLALEGTAVLDIEWVGWVSSPPVVATQPTMVAAKHSTNTLRVSFIVFLLFFLVALPPWRGKTVLSRGEIVRDDLQMGRMPPAKKLMQCVAE